MFEPINAFTLYWVSSFAIVMIFAYLYVRLTPYNELDLIQKGKIGPALTLSGAMIGYALPIAAVITHSGHLLEMVAWAFFSAFVQFVAYQIIRFLFVNFHVIIGEKAGIAPAIVLSTLSVILGILSAACVTP